MVKKWRKRVERYEQVRQDMRRLGADPDEIMDMALMLAQLGFTREQLPELARTMLQQRRGQGPWPPPPKLDEGAFER